jgi:hypothetical protein
VSLLTRTGVGLNAASSLLSRGTPHYNVKLGTSFHMLKAKVKLFLALVKDHTMQGGHAAVELHAFLTFAVHGGK